MVGEDPLENLSNLLSIVRIVDLDGYIIVFLFLLVFVLSKVKLKDIFLGLFPNVAIAMEHTNIPVN